MTDWVFAHPCVQLPAIIAFALLVLFLIGGVVWNWPGTDDSLAGLHMRAKIEKRYHRAEAARSRGDREAEQKLLASAARLQHKFRGY